MQAVTTIGLDIAKSVFQVHGIDAADQRRDVKFRLANLEPSTHGTKRTCAGPHHTSGLGPKADMRR
jgi:transposase